MKNLKILDTMNTGGVPTQFMPVPCVPPNSISVPPPWPEATFS